MSKKTKIILVIVICVIVIAGLVTFLSLNNKAENKVDETAPPPKVNMDGEADKKIEFAPPTKEEKQASSVKAVAIMFAERFGSYTNESNYININELLPLMTESMADWSRNTYLPKLKKDHDPAGFFYRVITNAPVADMVEQREATAKVRVSTQREETVGQAEPKTFLQDLVIDLVLKNNEWLVDGAFWQPKK